MFIVNNKDLHHKIMIMYTLHNMLFKKNMKEYME